MSQMLLSTMARSLLMKNNALMACNKFSTDIKAVPSKIYEFRVYTGDTKEFKKVLALCNDNIHLRLKHSKLFGFWSSEIGSSIFQVLSLWEYDSLSHRRQVRKGLLQDKVWQEFLPQLTPLLQTMTNSLLVPTPGYKTNTDFKNDPDAVYVLQNLSSRGQDPVPVRSGGQREVLVGRFTSVFGPTKSEKGYSLLMYPATCSPIS